MVKLVSWQIIGILFVLLGFVAVVMPIVPGFWLVFLGLEILGLRLIWGEKMKKFLNDNSSKK